MAFNVNQINQNTQYTKQKADVKLEHSALNMNPTDSSSGYVGKLIPVYVDELLPGQKVNIKQRVGMQFTPFVSNLYHEIRGQVMSFFIPMRLLVDEWEEFITGGKDGEYNTPLPRLKVSNLGKCVGTYTGSSFKYLRAYMYNYSTGEKIKESGLLHSLWDYFGLPISAPEHSPTSGDIDADEFNEKKNINMWADTGDNTISLAAGLAPTIADAALPNAHFFKAYYKIWNDVLRIPDIDDEIPLGENDNWNDIQLLRWYWPNDYFTRARVYQQRGVTPSIPINNGNRLNIDFAGFTDAPTSGQVQLYSDAPPGSVSKLRFQNDTTPGSTGITGSVESGSFSINDFLESLAIARYQFNNAKIQPRYIEHLKQRFHVDPQDYRVQLPEYLSNWRFSVNINTITQTSESNKSPQGTMTSQGTSQNGGTLTYEAKEHGVIMSLMVVRPYAVYQQGMPAMFNRTTRFDFATPELANTPDVPLRKGELFHSFTLAGSSGVDVGLTATNNDAVFGWRGIYDEYRTRINKVTGLLRSNIPGGLASYSLARYFDSSPALNKEFMRCNPDMDRVKALPSEPDFMYFFENNIDTAAPIPYESEPAAFASL